jgi:glycosyltransferase involved in cell wall biosynthesis
VALARRRGGVDVRVRQIAEALQGRRRYAVAVLEGSPLHRSLAKAGLSVLPLDSGRGDPRTMWRLYRAIRRGRFAVVDAHNPQSHLWATLAGWLARAPATICTVHNASRTSERSRLRAVGYEAILRAARPLGCRFVAVSPSIRDYLESLGIAPGRITMILNGIAIPDEALAPTGIVRRSLGWAAEHYVVAIVGRLHPVKGHRYLLSAIASLTDELPQIRCLVVGEGTERSAVQSEIQRLRLGGIVHLAGQRDDVPDLMRDSDLLCLPSLSEGMPFALLEAAAIGLPLLASKVGGMAAMLVHDETARLVPPGDSAALAAELRWFVEHREKALELGRSAREMVRRRYGVETMVGETLALYGRRL